MNWLDFSVMTPGSYPAGGWVAWLDGTWYTTHDPPTDDVYARIRRLRLLQLARRRVLRPLQWRRPRHRRRVPDVEVLTLVSTRFNLVLCGHDDVDEGQGAHRAVRGQRG